jgi:hypothetical protein
MATLLRAVHVQHVSGTIPSSFLPAQQSRVRLSAMLRVFLASLWQCWWDATEDTSTAGLPPKPSSRSGQGAPSWARQSVAG